MKKVYRMEELDCANCAAKIEEAIRALDGVRDASVSFLSQKMTVDFEDSVSEKEIMKKIVKLCAKIEPDCTVLI